jgi:hypothetical protein
MSALEGQELGEEPGEEFTVQAPSRPPRASWRRVGVIVLTVLVTQYTVTTLLVGLSVAGAVHYLVAPPIVAKFEAIATALKR